MSCTLPRSGKSLDLMIDGVEVGSPVLRPYVMTTRSLIHGLRSGFRVAGECELVKIVLMSLVVLMAFEVLGSGMSGAIHPCSIRCPVDHLNDAFS